MDSESDVESLRIPILEEVKINSLNNTGLKWKFKKAATIKIQPNSLTKEDYSFYYENSVWD